MENILKIENGSFLDNTLFKLYMSDKSSGSNWELFIKKLDENIITGELNFNKHHGYTHMTITFKDEESKMFFILKYA